MSNFKEVSQLEECERKERIARGGDDLRLKNAHTVAAIVKKLNFPILKYAKGTNKHFRCFEENERRRILNCPDEIKTKQNTCRKICKILNDAKNPTFTCRCRKGTHNIFRAVEERERRRRIANKEECNSRQANAHILSEGIRVEGTTARARLIRLPRKLTAWQIGTNILRHAYYDGRQTIAHAAELASEFTERAIHDAVEAVEGAAHAGKVVAEGAAQVGKAAAEGAVHAAEGVAHAGKVAAEGTAHVVEDAAHAGKVAAEGAVHAVENAAHRVALEAGKKSVSLPSISSIFGKAASLKQSLVTSMQNALRPTQAGGPLPDALKAVHLLEEVERARRIKQDAIDGIAQANARKVCRILTLVGLPTFQTRSGFKRYVRLLQERERFRLLSNKDECKRRQLGANKVAQVVSQLGWPFIQNKRVTTLDENPWEDATEEERIRRLKNSREEWVRRQNAQKVSGWIKQAMFSNQLKTNFFRNHTRNLEEKERAYRLANANQAIHNAHREAALIASCKKWGKAVETAKVDAKQIARQKVDRLERDERIRRMSDKTQQNWAKGNARALSKLVSSGKFVPHKPWPQGKAARQLAQEDAQYVADIICRDIGLAEEQERKSRLADRDQQEQTMANAHKVAGMIRILMKRQLESARKSAPCPVCPPAVPCAPCQRMIPCEPSTTPTVPITTTTIVQPSVPPTVPTTTHPAPITTTISTGPLPALIPSIPTQKQGYGAAPVSTPLSDGSVLTTIPATNAYNAPSQPTAIATGLTPSIPAPAAPVSMTSTTAAPITRGKSSSAPVTPSIAAQQFAGSNSATATPTLTTSVTPRGTSTFDKTDLAPAQAPLLASRNLGGIDSVSPAPTPASAPATGSAFTPTSDAPAPRDPWWGRMYRTVSGKFNKNNIPTDTAPATTAPTSVTSPTSAMPPGYPINNTAPTSMTSAPFTNAQPIAPLGYPSNTTTLPSYNTTAPFSNAPGSTPPNTPRYDDITGAPISTAPSTLGALAPATYTTTTTIPYTQTTYAPLSEVYMGTTPASFGLKTPITTQADPRAQLQLVESVRNQYEREIMLANKEQQKVANLNNRPRGGPFGKFRVQRHESAAAKHLENAKRHEDWLRAHNNASSMPSL